MQKIKITRWTRKGKPTLGLLQKELKEEGLEGSLFTSNPGDVYPNHSHAYDEVRVMVKGRVKFVVGGERFVLNPGDRIEFLKDTVHSAEVDGEQIAVMLTASKKA